MGLAVYDGKAQRRVSGRGDLSKGRTKSEATAEAIAMGYSPSRRALMHVIGDNLLKLNDGEFRAAYDAARTRQQVKRCGHPWPRTEAKSATCKDCGYSHKWALRYMEKRFLLRLWQEWRRSALVELETPSMLLADATELEGAADGVCVPPAAVADERVLGVIACQTCMGTGFIHDSDGVEFNCDECGTTGKVQASSSELRMVGRAS
jgi:predicted RNA-binding Zn-ribbon protein involved in translation (DUF1610 family)